MRRPKRASRAGRESAKATDAMTSLTIHMRTGEVVPDSQTLQQRIDAAGAGTTLDVSAWSYTAGATVNKALTIVGGTVSVPSGQKGLVITASNVEINGMSITGPQHTVLNTGEFGIHAYGASSGSPITGLNVHHCTITNFAYAGVWTKYATAPSVDHNTITHIGYGGIMFISCVGGQATYNTVSGVGNPGWSPTARRGTPTTSG